jgi:hypothetical protein
MIAHRHLLALTGLIAYGDLANTTIYRSHWKTLIAFQKTFPDKPPSAEQLQLQDLFRQAAAAWRNLSPLQRAQWATAAARASLCATGYNAYVHYWITADNASMRTLARQTRTTLTLTP